jgi:hypothetical protein
MSNTRINSYSNAQPDPYGNMFGSMVPKKAISPAEALKKKADKENLSNLGLGRNTTSAYQNSIEQIEKPVEERFETDVAAAGIGTLAAGAGAYKAKLKADGSNKKQAAGAAGVGAATAVAGIAGNQLTKNKQEIGGGILSGAAAGASMGSFIPVWGTAVGAVIGGVVGGITGNMKQKKRLLAEKTANAERNAYNKQAAAINRRNLGQAADLDRYEGLLRNSKNYEKGGKLTYKRPGLLRYGSLDIQEGLDYINNLKVERKKNGGKLENVSVVQTEKFQNGGAMADKKAQFLAIVKKGLESGMKPDELAKKLGVSKEMISKAIFMLNPENAGKVQGAAAQAPMFKRGGKTQSCKKGGKCGCTKCATTNLARVFRRGGVVDIDKQNVIVDGPSHDDLNKTGVKGDKGLPVVMNGKKVAEIESEELVINAKSSKQIEALKAKVKAGDKKAEEELGELLLRELHTNTYDYSELTKD